MINFLGSVAALILDPLVWLICGLLGHFTRSIGYASRLLVMLLVSVGLLAILSTVAGRGFALLDLLHALVAYSVLCGVVLMILRHKPKLEPLARELCAIVGRDLHLQISNALRANEALAGKRIQDLSSAGYIYGFIEAYLEEYPMYRPIAESMYSQILNGVLPNKLEAAFIANYAKYCIAVESEILSREVGEFKLSVAIGKSDAKKAYNYETPLNLELYLKGDKPKFSNDLRLNI